jgi:hypothetical protein
MDIYWTEIQTTQTRVKGLIAGFQVRPKFQYLQSKPINRGRNN